MNHCKINLHALTTNGLYSQLYLIMTQEERIEWCKKCTNRRVSVSEGLLCDLTSEPPKFEGTCPDFNEQVTPVYVDTPESIREYGELSTEEIQTLQQNQNFNFAIVAAVLSALLGAVVWAAITVGTGYQIGFMALGIGALVGFAVQFVGKGVDQKFGFLGGAFAFIGCVLGNIFGLIALTANYAGLSYLQVLDIIPFNALMEAMAESFGIVDLVFYGLAITEGYKFAFRRLKPSELQNMRK